MKENRTILIAEDDKDIIELLTLYLENNNFSVVSAQNGEDALRCIKNGNVDLALIDLMMPKMNGYDLIKKVREKYDFPIIIISAKNFDSDKILGLDIGADAYITKPFNPLEVVAYVKANLRRFFDSDNKKKEIVLGELVFNQERFELTKNGTIIPLTATELKIVSKLINNPGHIFTKLQLCECINTVICDSDDNTIMVHISNIRSKIEDNPLRPKYIKTVRGLGYKIENRDS